jgi:murein DD-endopeptidase MepM/ murein hydrolase activator NlpD
LLSKDAWKMIDYIEDNPNKNLVFAINTNLCVPDELVDKIISKIQNISIDTKEFQFFTSGEALGAPAEYIRYGLDYNKWSANLEKVLDNTNVKLLKDIQELEINLKNKTDEYNKLSGSVITEGKFPEYLKKFKDELPGGEYGGRYKSTPQSNTNAPIRISSDYGERAHPISGRRSFHEGVDIAMPVGTDIYAAEKGKVSRSGSATGYGNMIEIDHGNGKTTRYAHLKSMNVAVGDMVEKGQKIALSGNSGDSTGPHLHFEERENGQATRPSQQMLLSSIKGQLLNDGSIALNAASRPDTSPPNVTVVNQQTAAAPQQSKPQNAAASAHNFDPWTEIWSASILNPARMGS